MKQKLFSRTLSLLLALVMCLGMLPGAVLAEDAANLGVPPDVSSDKSEETISLTGEEVEPQETVDAGSWKIQDWGGDTDVELHDGWITPAVEGTGFTLNYKKIIMDRGKEGLVIYDSATQAYGDSTLELDITVAKADGADDQVGFYSVGVLPRFTDGKNCEGLAIHDKGRLQRAGYINGKENWDWLSGGASFSFEFDNTYHLKLITEGKKVTVFAAKAGEELTQIISFDTKNDLGASGYGFRIWRGGKTITVANIVRSEIVPSDIEESYLKETEKVIPYADWCKPNVGLDIPVGFAPEDEVTSIKDGDLLLIGGSDYSVDMDNSVIKLTPDFFKGKDNRDEIVLTVTFKSEVVATYKMTRGSKPAASNGWVLQKQNTTESVVPKAGWITTTATGGIKIDYGKIVAESGSEGWVIFDGEAPAYKNSVLEYDITFTDATQAPWVAVAPATRVTDGKNYEGFAFTQGTGLERTGRKNGSESYGGISNMSNTNVEYNKTYHLRMVG